LIFIYFYVEFDPYFFNWFFLSISSLNTIKNSRIFSLEDQQHDNITLDRPRCNIKPPIRYDFKDSVSYALITRCKDPTTFQEALHSQDKSKLMGVMEEEMQSLHKN